MSRAALKGRVAAPAPHPPPPGAHQASAPPAEAETSERIFRQRLLKAFLSFNLRDLRAMWREELLEPHMHLFVLLVAAFGVGILIWVAEPLVL